jgi:mannose-6-phosphate isomerase-like protein (cupin superfamily)
MYCKRFEEFPEYTDPGSINQKCRDILPRGKGEYKDLGMGVCRITGPGRVGEDAHADWTQYFIVTEGKGTLYYDSRPVPIHAGMIIEIPRLTRHYVSCGEGENIAYFYINGYVTRVGSGTGD